MGRVGALMALALVVLLTACSEQPVTAPTTSEYAAQRDALKASMGKGFTADKKRPSAEEVEGETASDAGYAAVVEGYIYDSTGKRDPFRSFQFEDKEVPKTGFGPLGDYELGQLSVSAVLWDTNNPRALVSDPGGRSFVIREGSQIGKNNGRVIHIGDNLVLVKETFVDFEGNQSTKDVEMHIRRSQGG